MTEKQIIRIDKQDGSESVETDMERMERLIRNNYLGNPQTKLKHFLDGQLKIQTPGAYYEMRDKTE